MWSVREGSRDVSDGQHEDLGKVPWGLQAPSSTLQLDPAAGIASDVGDAATQAQLPGLKSALKRASSSPRRQQQVVHFTPQSAQTPDSLAITPNTNWSTWVSPSYSSPPYQDPNQNSHSSYTISQPQIHNNSNNYGGDASGSSQQTCHPQQPLIMQYPPNFNPQTPPQQTAGYHPTPSPPLSTPQQQQQPTHYPLYGLPQSTMMPGRRAPVPPPQQQYPPQLPMMMPPQQNMMHMSTNPMQAWYDSIPEPKMGPFQPPIPLMRGTQFMPGLSSMHPVSCFLVSFPFPSDLMNILDLSRFTSPACKQHKHSGIFLCSCPFTFISPPHIPPRFTCQRLRDLFPTMLPEGTTKKRIKMR